MSENPPPTLVGGCTIGCMRHISSIGCLVSLGETRPFSLSFNALLCTKGANLIVRSYSILPTHLQPYILQPALQTLQRQCTPQPTSLTLSSCNLTDMLSNYDCCLSYFEQPAQWKGILHHQQYTALGFCQTITRIRWLRSLTRCVADDVGCF